MPLGIRIDVYHHVVSAEPPQQVLSALARIELGLLKLQGKVDKMSTEAETLVREVQETKAAVRAVFDKVIELRDQLLSNQGDKAAMEAASAELDALQAEAEALLAPSTPEQPGEPTE